MNKTKIRWTDYTSNPIYVVDKATGKRGWACSRVSPGCEHCYAATLNRRLGTGYDYTEENLEKVRFVLNRGELEAWSRLKVPSKIFIVDMGDLFNERIPIEYLDTVFEAMEQANWHTYQVLTKRPGTMERYIQRRGKPGHHIWLGTSVEDSARTPRIDVLRRIPCDIRFLSCEPLLSSLGTLNLDGISWVIAGGESGPGYREMNPDWARKVRDQCVAQRVPFFYKQSSGIRPEMSCSMVNDGSNTRTRLRTTHQARNLRLVN